MNDMFQQTMRISSQSDMHDVWLRAKKGESFEGEEAVLAHAMQEHAEYLDIWEQLDENNRSEIVVNGVNPILHISMHSVIENQLKQNTPPEVRKALDALLKHGASRHEAIHAIAYEFNMELFSVLKHSRTFNNIAYKRRLEILADKKQF